MFRSRKSPSDDDLTWARQLTEMLGIAQVSHQMPSTLSGGESFMVSLALALGLSDMMQGGRGSDMLFIDEGFGTLDYQSLNAVLVMLQKLHLQGRKVGIISHVPELEERIDAKILVRKCTGDNTRSEVIIS